MNNFKNIWKWFFGVLISVAIGVNGTLAYSSQEVFDYFKNKGFITASTYESFRANDTINKAEFIKLLVLASGADKNAVIVCP